MHLKFWDVNFKYLALLFKIIVSNLDSLYNFLIKTIANDVYSFIGSGDFNKGKHLKIMRNINGLLGCSHRHKNWDFSMLDVKKPQNLVHIGKRQFQCCSFSSELGAEWPIQKLICLTYQSYLLKDKLATPYWGHESRF